MRAIELWSSVYGAEAGNLALKSLSTSGVYVCGGVFGASRGVLAKGLPARRKEPSARGRAASPFLEALPRQGAHAPAPREDPGRRLHRAASRACSARPRTPRSRPRIEGAVEAHAGAKAAEER